MSFNKIMNTILPNVGGNTPHVTGNYNEPRGKGTHGGVDFNYRGGQTGINLTNPTVHSPVDGTVVFVGGNYGTVAIRDANGNLHQILHTNSQLVQPGQKISTGNPIGTMGGTGPKGANQYAHHVHYQIKDPKGNLINPQQHWDNQPKCEEEDGEGGGATGPANDGNVGAGLGANRDPFVLDLDGDGIELGTLADSQAYFDLNGDGFATRTSWLKGDDGFLALDRNQDGKINDITELFGSPDRTGYEELSELDSNADGVIDKADERFAELLVWQDVNEDGISQADELKSLTEAGIVSISLTHESVTDQQGDGQLARRGSFTWKDGTQGTAGETPGIAADVLFAQHPTFTKYTGTVTIDPTVTTVANIKGYGQIPDLHIAMSLDMRLDR